MQAQPEQSEAPPLAKITDRFLAYFLDFFPFVIGYFLTLYLLVLQWGRLPNYNAAVWHRTLAGWAVLYLAYQALGNMSGATFGKRMYGIRVVRADDFGPLSPGRAVVRALGYLFSMPLANLGFLWSLKDSRSRSWHDLMAGSIVVEDRPKPPGSELVSLVLSVFLLFGCFYANYWFFLGRPTPMDQAAVAKAEEGLQVLAAIQESYRAVHGRYTRQLSELAAQSGDVDTFKRSMARIFDPDGFLIEAGNTSYRIQARARDRRRTSIQIAGP